VVEFNDDRSVVLGNDVVAADILMDNATTVEKL
jgi:hypothetical protein